MTGFPWKIATVAGLVVGGVLALKARNEKRQPTSPGRVALIGDSYAVGLGSELQRIFPDFRYEGHTGTSTSQWVNRVRSKCDQCGDWLIQYKPDLVLVSLGVNDGSNPNANNYATIVRDLQSIGASVKWISPPSGVNQNAQAIIESLGVPTTPPPKVSLVDGIHPSSYIPWAREIASSIG